MPMQGTSPRLRADLGAASAASSSELSRWQPTPQDPWDRRKAKHLLRRAGFGGTPREIEAAVELGMDRTVDLLLTVSTGGLQTGGWAVLPNGQVLDLSTYEAQRGLWVWECTHGQYPLREKMALFWHDHFSVGAPGAPEETMTAHINVFRRHGLGRFRDLLVAVSQDPAMLVFLDNWRNGQPMNGTPTVNENYGRELLELYTIGEGNGYTQEDVRASSKCLTGWSAIGPGAQYYYRRAYHFPGPKIFLGTEINNSNVGNEGEQDAYDLIDTILAHPSPARYVGTKIWEYFVAENPDTALVDELADLWRNSGYDIRSLMDVILRSNYFYSDQAIRQLVKSPAEFMVGAVRNLNLPYVGGYSRIGKWIEDTGLPMLRYGSPEGVDEGAGWLTTLGMIFRMNYATELTRMSGSDIKAVYEPYDDIVAAGLTTSEQIVDHYLELLVDDQVSTTVRQNLLYFMEHDDWGPDPLVYPLSPAQIRAKVSGLVKLIMSLPEYSIS